MHPLKKEMNCRLLLVFVTIIVSAIVYFINTGFELNDEGFYFNGYDRAQPIFFSLTGFHYLVRLLPFSSSVIINRIYRLLLHGLSAFILAKALSRYFKLNIPFVELFLWMLLGNLYSYVYAPPSLSYNVINLFLLQMSLAAYLYFISEGQRYNKYYLLLIILISLLFFNKLTTGILLCLLLSLDFFFREGEHKFLKIVKLISFYFSVGIGVFLCFYLVNGQHLFDAVQMIIKKEGPFNIKHTNEFYQAKQLLWNPFYQSKKQIIFVFGYLLVFYISGLRHFKEGIGKIVVLIGYLSLTAALFIYYLSHYACGPGTEIFTAIILFLVTVFYLQKTKTEGVDVKMLLLILLLPIAGFFGSDVSPFEGMNHYAVFFIFLIIYFLTKNKLNFSVAYGFLLTVFILVRFIWFPFENPFLFSIKNKVEIKNASTALYVSDKVMSRQNNFNEIKKVINSNVDKVFLNVSPGLLYLNSMHNYGSMYYNNAPGLSGYIELIKLTGVPVTAEYIICKEQLSNESSEKINAYFAFYKSLKSNPDTLFDNVNYTVLTMRQE